MARHRKTRINLNNEDSLRELLQEIFNDANNQMRRALSDIEERKNRHDIETPSDEFQISKVNNESLKLHDSAMDKKIAIAKLQAQVLVGSSSKEKEDDKKNDALGEDTKKMLRDMIKDSEEKNNVKYDI